MNKKTIIAVVVLAAIFAGGTFLMSQNSKAAVADLNKTLPDGVRVVKSLFGNEYRVVNKIDGYEFRAPREWHGIVGIQYEDPVTDPESIRTSFKRDLLLDSVESEKILSVIGKDGLDNGVEIRKLLLKNPQGLEDFIKVISSGFVSKLRRNNREIISVVESLEESKQKILKLHIKLKRLGESEQSFLEYILFDSNSGIYVFDGTSTQEDNRMIRDIILTGKW